MSTIVDDPTPRLAAGLRLEREARGWTLAELAQRSGVSKAMISKIERGAASPTAALLGRLSGAFGLSLSALIARAELRPGRLLRAADQPTWRDPATGYVRRHLSPGSDLPLDLVHVALPAGASVRFPASAYAFLRHQIWLISGRLDFVEGAVTHAMEPGDCLELGPPADCTYRAPGPEPAVYLVAVLRQ
ncbi:MAG: helix-turn-helix domain-containing protein [Alphaproteobacteria bacterium]